ncbi:hypothetical protein HK096_001589, partial [Nowakowskiella sp. JEL0078]
MISEVHFHLAESLADKGDLDGAIQHSQKCRKMRERCYGQMDVRTVEVYKQCAKLVLAPYIDYKGVITPQIRLAYREAINCYEKFFRFLKNSKSVSSNKGLNSGILSSGGSVSRFSMISISHVLTEQTSRLMIGIGNGSSNRPTTYLEGTCAPPTVGPLLSFPSIPAFASPRPSLLHQLTKQIIGLKLDLLENPRHKECVRTLRATDDQNQKIEATEAKEIILRLAAVSPSVYLDGILSRIEDGDDEEAVRELGIVLQLTEKETVGFSQ